MSTTAAATARGSAADAPSSATTPAAAGLSDRSTQDFSLEAQITDLTTVVDHLGLDRFDLFGRSQATPAAITFAHRFPERVSHLILLNPFAHASYNVERSDRFRSQREAADQNWEEYTLMSASVGTNFVDAQQARTLASWFRKAMTPASFQAFWREAVKFEVVDLLPEIKVPTLVIHSGAFNYPMEHAREVAAGIPDARIFVKPAKSDYYFWSDEETQAVEAFLGAPSPVDAAAPRAVPDPPPSVLTPRETEVLRLIAAGRSEQRDLARADAERADRRPAHHEPLRQDRRPHPRRRHRVRHPPAAGLSGLRSSCHFRRRT